MNIKWCAFTGALMLLFVGATWVHQTVSQDRPGVSTRWWDGTRKSVQENYANGKPQSHIEYGEDGKTVLSEREWSEDGALTFSKERLSDGTLEVKGFTDDGKTLLLYVLWNGDEQSFRIERRYSPVTAYLGKIVSETIKTEDGQIVTEQRSYAPPGILQTEYKILDDGWADQQTDSYTDGKLVNRSIVRGSGDTIEINFRDDGTMSFRSTHQFFNGDQTVENFDKKGRPLVTRYTPGDAQGAPVISVYAAGKLKYKQTFKDFQLALVEQYSTDTAKIDRRLVIGADQTVVEVRRFRPDGTLAQVKYLKGSQVIRQVDFNQAGTAAVSDKPGGEPEAIDSDWLQPGDQNLWQKENGQ